MAKTSAGAFSLVGVYRYPQAISDAHIRGLLLSTLQKRAREMEKDWDKVMATWRGKPTMESQVRYKGGTIIVTVFSESEVLGFLDQGTSVRYVAMSRDFVPKTRVRWIGSQAGRGGPVLWGSKFDDKYPGGLPGIEPRQWSSVISAKHQPKIRADIRGVLGNIWMQRIMTIP